MDWKRICKAITIVCGALVAFAGALTAWVNWGFWTPASRAYVQEELWRVTPAVLLLTRDRIQDMRIAREGIQARHQKTTDVETRADLQRLLDKVDQELAMAEAMAARLKRRDLVD